MKQFAMLLQSHRMRLCPLRKDLKIMFIFGIILCVGVSSCSERNQPDSKGGGAEQEQGIVVNKRYIIEQSQKYTWVDTTSTYVGLIGYSIRQVTERETEAKYKKKYSLYIDGVLQSSITYVNSGNAEYGTYSYSKDNASLVGTSADTTYYYDADRIFIKESRSSGIRINYTYDNQNRLLTMIQHYGNTKIYDCSYRYNGNHRYGNTTSYSVTGVIQTTVTDTAEFSDNSCKYEKSNSQLTIYYDTLQNTIKNYSTAQNQIGTFGVTKSDVNTFTYYKDGSISKGRVVYYYNWSDELNMNGYFDVYEGNKKIYTQELIYRYKK